MKRERVTSWLIKVSQLNYVEHTSMLDYAARRSLVLVYAVS